MEIIFPDFERFLNKHRRLIQIFWFIFFTVAEMFVGFEAIEFLVIFLAVASMLQIFYVAQKRKDIEKFSQNQNATVCFTKCFSLVLYQITIGCVLSLIDIRLFCSIFRVMNVWYLHSPQSNKGFQLVGSISENSWREFTNIIRKNYNPSTKNVIALIFALLVGINVFTKNEIILFWLGMISGLSLAFKIGSQYNVSHQINVN
jgi:hypothetical protein